MNRKNRLIGNDVRLGDPIDGGTPDGSETTSDGDVTSGNGAFVEIPDHQCIDRGIT